MKELLFSYGTLQLEKVQMETFGRLLKGTRDILHGYRIEKLEIRDEEVLRASKEKYHPIAVPSQNQEAIVPGTVFELSLEEILSADTYEAEEYKRVKEKLASGRIAWVYIANEEQQI